MIMWCKSGPEDIRGTKQFFSNVPRGVTIFMCTTWNFEMSSLSQKSEDFHYLAIIGNAARKQTASLHIAQSMPQFQLTNKNKKNENTSFIINPLPTAR